MITSIANRELQGFAEQNIRPKRNEGGTFRQNNSISNVVHCMEDRNHFAEQDRCPRTREYIIGTLPDWPPFAKVLVTSLVPRPHDSVRTEL